MYSSTTSDTQSTLRSTLPCPARKDRRVVCWHACNICNRSTGRFATITLHKEKSGKKFKRFSFVLFLISFLGKGQLDSKKRCISSAFETTITIRIDEDQKKSKSKETHHTRPPFHESSRTKNTKRRTVIFQLLKLYPSAILSYQLFHYSDFITSIRVFTRFSPHLLFAFAYITST